MAISQRKLGEQIVHIILADIIQHDLLGFQGKQSAAEFTSDGAATAGDQDGFAFAHGFHLRHIQRFLGTAQQIGKVQVTYSAFGGFAGQILHGRNAFDPATGSHALFNQRFQIPVRCRNGDDDLIDVVIAGKAQNITRAADDRYSAESRTIPVDVIIHHHNRNSFAIITALHLMHQIGTCPSGTDDHYTTQPLILFLQQRKMFFPNDQTVEDPAQAYQNSTH